MSTKNYKTFCLLCNKHFVSEQNLKRHNNYLHKLCEASAFTCNYCNCGFESWEAYENHNTRRLKKMFARKTKKRRPQMEVLESVPDQPASVEPPSSPTPLDLPLPL